MAVKKTATAARAFSEIAQAQRIKALETEVFELKTRLEAAQARATRVDSVRAKGVAGDKARLDELLRQKDATIMGLAAQIATLSQDIADRAVDDAGARTSFTTKPTTAPEEPKCPDRSANLPT